MKLLQPFAHYTNVTGSEEMTSIGMVFPLIMELRLHLEEVSHFNYICIVTKFLLHFYYGYNYILFQNRWPPVLEFQPLQL